MANCGPQVPLSVPPVVTLFLFFRLIGARIFLSGCCGADHDNRERLGKRGSVSCGALVCGWLGWILPHYVLVLVVLRRGANGIPDLRQNGRIAWGTTMCVRMLFFAYKLGTKERVANAETALRFRAGVF